MLICSIGLLLALSISTPAQTNDSPKRDSENKTSESACAAMPLQAQASDVNSRERRSAEDRKAESAYACRFLISRQSVRVQATQHPSQATGANDTQESKNGELVIAPYPISSPALGTGLQWVVGYVFRLNNEDKVTPPSFFGTVGMYTSNGSWGALCGGSFHLKEDKYRVVAAVADGSINWDFYGVGKVAGDRGLFLPINISGRGFGVQTLVRVGRNLYIGPRFQLRHLDAQIDFSALQPRGLPEVIDRMREDIAAAVPRDLLSARTVAIGPHLQRDTRNDLFYPTKGTVLNLGGDFFSKSLGSKFNYQTYQVRFEGYRSLNARQVVAFGSIGCAAAGDRVPFYDLCLFGARNYLRGYSAGRFQDRRMLATQVEYRLRLPKLMGIGLTERFGVVGFGGVGWVGRRLGDLAFNELLPGGGGGLRFRLTKKYPINFRIDYGIGRVGHTVSMGVTEAF